VASASADLLELWPEFALSLQAEHRSPRTIISYSEAVRQFSGWLEGQGRPTTIAEITRADVAGWVASLLEWAKPATCASRYRALHRYFGWAVDEEELAVSPMVKMHPPTVELAPPPVLDEEQLRRLLKTCEGAGFQQRRDMAILRCLIDTGCRLGELAALSEEDVDINYMALHVLGKGRRQRSAPFGPTTGVALNRYRRARREHPLKDSPYLWLGLKGQLGVAGIAHIVDSRGRQAGLGHLHPHQFRHTAAHRWQLAGGNESDLMTLMGWRSRTMLARYGASAAAGRARESHRRLALSERL
jgi:site-specific recombinase XerD